MGKEVYVDYYEVLQVSTKADQKMIERAFRLLAKRYHPDNRHTGDAGKFDIPMGHTVPSLTQRGGRPMMTIVRQLMII